MGLLDLILGQNNGISRYVDTNKNAVHGAFAGFGQGTNIGDGFGYAARGAATGAPVDDVAAASLAADAARQKTINDTVKYLQAKHPDIAAQLSAGLPLDQAWSQALKVETPGYGSRTVSPGETVLGADNKPVFTAPDRPSASSIPSGYRPTKDGLSLEPIPGGPADPTSAQSLSPEALDLIATQYLAGDKSVVSGYARNASMRAQISNAIAAKAAAAGMDGKSIAAELSAYGGNVAAQRSAGTRAAQVGMAASEANQMADIALTASQKVPRGAFVPWNAAMNAVATGTSSPEMAAFVTATTSLVNAYARAVSPLGAPTDAMRQHAEQMLNTAQGPEAYSAVIAQMKKEMEAALNAPAEISKQLKSNVTGDGQDAPVDYKQKYGLD